MTAYEFFEQAFVLYEESIPDSRQEVRALQSIMGTLNRQASYGQRCTGARLVWAWTVPVAEWLCLRWAVRPLHLPSSCKRQLQELKPLCGSSCLSAPQVLCV